MSTSVFMTATIYVTYFNIDSQRHGSWSSSIKTLPLLQSKLNFSIQVYNSSLSLPVCRYRTLDEGLTWIVKNSIAKFKLHTTRCSLSPCPLATHSLIQPGFLFYSSNLMICTKDQNNWNTGENTHNYLKHHVTKYQHHSFTWNGA